MRILIIVALTVPCLATPTLAAEQQAPCGPHSAIVGELGKQYHEEPRALGLSKGGMMMEITVSPAGRYTILMSTPQGVTCMMDAGEGFQWKEPKLKDGEAM